jgi:hypothetical protein
VNLLAVIEILFFIGWVFQLLIQLLEHAVEFGVSNGFKKDNRVGLQLIWLDTN